MWWKEGGKGYAEKHNQRQWNNPIYKTKENIGGMDKKYLLIWKKDSTEHEENEKMIMNSNSILSYHTYWENSPNRFLFSFPLFSLKHAGISSWSRLLIWSLVLYIGRGGVWAEVAYSCLWQLVIDICSMRPFRDAKPRLRMGEGEYHGFVLS